MDICMIVPVFFAGSSVVSQIRLLLQSFYYIILFISLLERFQKGKKIKIK